MLFWFWMMLAISLQGGSAPTPPAVARPEKPAAPVAPRKITSTASPAGPAAPSAPASPSTPAPVAEPQQPTGRFTTATEVKPILTATKSAWVAVREYEGRDLVYVTQILSWRCGLAGMTLSINGAPPEIWDLPPCHIDTAAPNALTPEDGLPFRAYPLGAVQSITVTLTYDDLTTDTAQFARAQVLMP